MSLIGELFGQSPFKALIEHTKKVHECVQLVRPLLEACINADYDGIHRLQDQVTKLEYEADVIKHEIREHLPRRFFLPVPREDLERFLHDQDNIADHCQDFAVILMLRQTKIHPDLVEEFRALREQVLKTTDILLAGAQDLDALASSSFGGAEAKQVLERIKCLGEEEWKADRLQRKLSRHIYVLEKDLDPVTIMFYEKIIYKMSRIANAAENTGDMLRQMIVKG